MRSLPARTIAIVVAVTGALWAAPPASASSPSDGRGGVIDRVSVSPSGGSWDYPTDRPPAISANGRYVAFASMADDLAPGDDNGRGQDIFVRDMWAGHTTLVSQTPAGVSGNGDCRYPSISADGRYVAFDSSASDLVPGDTNGEPDVFVHDLRLGRTVRADVGPGGAQADDGAVRPDISADGRHVAFDSGSADLVAGDTNGTRDVFVRDLAAGRTVLVSLTADGAQSTAAGQDASISADGNRVAFLSSVGLVPGPLPPVVLDQTAYVRDRARRTTTEVSAGLGDAGFHANGVNEVAIADDGRTVAFTLFQFSPASLDYTGTVWVAELRAGTRRPVSPVATPATTSRGSFSPGLSGDGRFVAFASADRLIKADTDDLWDIYLRDLRTGAVRRLTGGQTSPYGGSIGSDAPVVSADGRQVAFYSDAAGLAPGGTPATPHIYRWSRH